MNKTYSTAIGKTDTKTKQNCITEKKGALAKMK